MLLDILAGTGSMVAWLGHAAALTGAVARFKIKPFRPIGVSTRAGATFFAMEHGLAWGEFPIPRTGGDS
jgi:hypothetical protein